ncbi:hypothetical protein [Litchfieldella xinjiangensis]|uniref:hypothetical protein n=1 Tax=Litchfieldella xinjiangensis TaxID=1166948 RepID=UPI0005BBAA66|nr:hypothetical protein [Halomonas xinjiangensis]
MPRLSLLAVCLLLTLATALPASARMYDEKAVENLGSWRSMILVRGETRLFRAVNEADNPDAALSVVFVPGHCRPQLELRVEMHDEVDETETLPADPAAFRVDHAPLHDATVTLTREPGDSGAYARFQFLESYRLVHELGLGEILRVKMGGNPPWYLVFSLAGASASIERAARLCHHTLSEGANALEEGTEFEGAKE